MSALVDDRDEYPNALWNLGYERWREFCKQEYSHENWRLAQATIALADALEKVEKGVPSHRDLIEAEERESAAQAARSTHIDRQMAAFEPVLKEQIRKYAERNTS